MYYIYACALHECGCKRNDPPFAASLKKSMHGAINYRYKAGRLGSRSQGRMCAPEIQRFWPQRLEGLEIEMDNCQCPDQRERGTWMHALALACPRCDDATRKQTGTGTGTGTGNDRPCLPRKQTASTGWPGLVPGIETRVHRSAIACAQRFRSKQTWPMRPSQHYFVYLNYLFVRCRLFVFSPPSARVQESWRLAGGYRIWTLGRWDAGTRPLGRWLGNAHGGAFISAGAWGRQGRWEADCPLTVEIER